MPTSETNSQICLPQQASHPIPHALGFPLLSSELTTLLLIDFVQKTLYNKINDISIQ